MHVTRHQGGKLTLGNILQANVEHGIVKRPAHQELQTQVVDPLTICESLALLSSVPFEDQAVAEGQAGSRVGSRFVAVEHATRKCCLDMTDNLVLEFILVLKATDLMFGPGFSLGFWDRSCVVDDLLARTPPCPSYISV